ncbi:MAG: hypothetical protein RMI56_03045 [Sulfolobales archaeon]|nr:hypothetical protein [Sulfolobales archaeon]MDW8082757.1 hypothetical protein [Sulfolobales archaeon]
MTALPCANCGETKFNVPLKENTFHRYVCPRCKTPTYVYITQNFDMMMIGENELCPSCGGTGKCVKCKGTGMMICPTCGGKGYYSTRSWNYVGCRDCGGKKVGDDYEDIVKGSGLVKCIECLGNGVCPTCMGYRIKIKK